MVIGRNSSLEIRPRTEAPADRIVLVSDDPSLGMSLRASAPDLDRHWILAPTGREAVTAVEDRRARLVVLDGALRERPAVLVLRLLKRIRPDLPLLFAFDQPSEEWEREAREAGVVYYGDRAGISDLLRVIRKGLRRPGGPRPGPAGTRAGHEGGGSA